MFELGYGLLSEWWSFSLLMAVVGFLALGFIGAPFVIWTAAILGSAWLLGVSFPVFVAAASILAIFNVKPLRMIVISSPLLNILRGLGVMPKISDTEATAIEAGSTWVDGQLFSGQPDFKKINAEAYPELSAEEKAFVDGPVEELCSMVSDWEIFTNEDLPERVWSFIKKERFLGMILPKEHGGLGFSGIAHSEVIQKLTSRSVPLAVTVMVPNSLGPGELILHYGTDEQKKHYLPRLARGEEIPCFALTEPNAGSDAGSLTSRGEIFKDASGQICLKLNWDKRYITLAAISTIIGLAVRVRDPENLLGKGKDLGITCVLVPANSKGVVLGKRHNPMGVPFYNCPTQGKDVIVSIDQVIGGQEGVGQGWRMLMESLAAGRAISLPAQSVGTAKLTARVTSAYSVIREQFGVSIGKFEGIEERLARIFGLTYMLEATRRFTAGAVDSGVKPAVISAIAKAYTTEISRQVIIDGMDVLGGAGISRGPKNVLANPYIGSPIGITVEGANILTRSMIIFGQGALRCHPYAYREFKAIENKDYKEFDRAFWGHIGHVFANLSRSIVLSVTRGHLAKVPFGANRRYYQKLSWSSAVFALMSDVAMGSLGGKLKFKEKLTGRYADVLSWMYLATATLKRFEAEGRPTEDQAFVDWVMQYSFTEIQKAFDGIFRNFEVPLLSWVFRGPIAWWSSLNRLSQEPSDENGRRLVSKMLKPGKLRDRMTTGIFIPARGEEQIHLYEETFNAVHEAAIAYRKIRHAIDEKKLPKKMSTKNLLKMAVEQNILTQDEANIVEQAAILRNKAVQVDSFDVKNYHTGHLEGSYEPSNRKTG